MKRYLRFLPLGSIPMFLAMLAIVLDQMHHPLEPVLLQEGYQSFVGVLMLLMQF